MPGSLTGQDPNTNVIAIPVLNAYSMQAVNVAWDIIEFCAHAVKENEEEERQRKEEH